MGKKTNKNKIVFGLFVTLALVMAFSFIAVKNKTLPLSPRNNYGEVLLGLNAEPRIPTDTDVIKGYITTDDKTFVVFESRQIKDMGMTSYWRIK